MRAGFVLGSPGLLCLLVLALLPLANTQHAYARREGRARRRCFQCNMPIQCESGSCYGDVCIKSLANGRYVSKGCENFTENVRSYRSQGITAWDPKRDKSYCKTEQVFGIESEICYCSDSDFCNATPTPRSYLLIPVATFSFFFLLLRV
ncbi:unnamed protein product, partial [Mesorhabditis spiculigera]